MKFAQFEVYASAQEKMQDYFAAISCIPLIHDPNRAGNEHLRSLYYYILARLGSWQVTFYRKDLVTIQAHSGIAPNQFSGLHHCPVLSWNAIVRDILHISEQRKLLGSLFF